MFMCFNIMCICIRVLNKTLNNKNGHNTIGIYIHRKSNVRICNICYNLYYLIIYIKFLWHILIKFTTLNNF